MVENNELSKGYKEAHFLLAFEIKRLMAASPSVERAYYFEPSGFSFGMAKIDLFCQLRTTIKPTSLAYGCKCGSPDSFKHFFP
jgi:hypothetical protein